MNATEKERLGEAQTLLTKPGATDADRRRALGIIKNLLAARTAPPEEKKLRKVVEDLAGIVVASVESLDREFSRSAPDEPARVRRGERVAAVRNALALDADRALYFGLSIPFPKQKKFKRDAIKKHGGDGEVSSDRTEGVRAMAGVLFEAIDADEPCPVCKAKGHAEGCAVVLWAGKAKR